MRVLLKPLATAVLREFTVCHFTVCVSMCVCVCACACSSVCVFLFASHWFRVPRALVFFSGTWLSSKPEVLIRIKITFLKGRSFSAAAEC